MVPKKIYRHQGKKEKKDSRRIISGDGENVGIVEATRLSEVGGSLI
jgi:hypothetical protein